MTLGAAALDRLGDQVRGLVIPPNHPDFDSTRRTFNSLLDHRPAVIVQPLDTADVVAAVRWSAEADLPISIRGGGHSVAGHSVGEGSLMLDLARLRGVSVDAGARIARVAGGSKLVDLDTATTAHGLAAPSGTYSDTGIGGLVLGGGISFLLASRGLACDALVGAELVLADGTVVDVDAERDPELLWALRGGGGNFGVVTQVRLALEPLPDVYLGRMNFRGSGASELLGALFELDAGAPDELTTQGVLANDPTEGPVVVIIGVWLGDPAKGAAAMAQFGRRADLLADVSQPISYLDLQLRFERMGPTFRHYWKSQFVGRADDGLVDAIVWAHASQSRSTSLILIEPMHGQVHRIPEDSAAFGARAAVANVSALAIWDDPADDHREIAWARDSAAAWAPWSLRGGGYVNYSPFDEGAGRVEQAYGSARFARLRTVKRRCDPDNRFRFNANIPPSV